MEVDFRHLRASEPDTDAGSLRAHYEDKIRVDDISDDDGPADVLAWVRTLYGIVEAAFQEGRQACRLVAFDAPDELSSIQREVLYLELVNGATAHGHDVILESSAWRRMIQ